MQASTSQAGVAAVPAMPPGALAAQPLEFLAFTLGQEEYGVDIQKVQELRGYDAILLDVDNGPDGLTRSVNDRLYHGEGLKAAKAALRTGGILAVWSAHPDDGFAERLRGAGFAVDEVVVPEAANDAELAGLASRFYNDAIIVVARGTPDRKSNHR